MTEDRETETVGTKASGALALAPGISQPVHRHKCPYCGRVKECRKFRCHPRMVVNGLPILDSHWPKKCSDCKRAARARAGW